MQNNIQEKLLEIGRSGCYFLCLLKIAEIKCNKSFSIIDTYEDFLTKSYIKRNCFVLNAKNILSDLCNTFVTYRWEPSDYKPFFDEFVIKRYAIKKGEGELTHFVLFDYEGNEIFNPLTTSPAYTAGKVADLRVFEIGK